jgi:hypothetical protein
MNIDLSKEDVEFLSLLLEREFKSALVELHHTSHRDFRQIVNARISEIETLLEKLKKAA